MLPAGAHPDPETLAAFGEGKLARREANVVLAHLEHCRDCVEALQIVNEGVQIPQRQRSRLVPWLAAAAAVIVLALAVAPLVYRRMQPSARLVALAPRNLRVSEARLSGGFPWARFAGSLRAGSDASDDPARLELMGAAGSLVADANRTKSARDEHAAGIALVLIEQPMNAVTRLQLATQLAPDDARAWCDLGAAQHAAALKLDRPSLFAQALASTEHALRIDATMPEARFNRAVILERMGLTDVARDAWREYLAVDSHSAWAEEAKQHVAALRNTTDLQRYKRDTPRLERAAASNDIATVAAIVDANRQQSRVTAEALTLGQWGEAFVRDDRDSTRLLMIARAVGTALQARGESLLRDAAFATPSRVLADAHVAYLHARLAYSRHEPAAAEPEFRRAADLFDRARSPMALVARYYAASARYDRNDVAGARAELLDLQRAAARSPQYGALRAQIDWQLALCAMSDGDWESALPLVTNARAIFGAAHESENAAFLDALLADTLAALGRHDDAWRARIRSFEFLGAGGHASRLAVSLDGAARMELRGGDREVARSILRIEEAVNRADRNDVLLTNTLVREAVLNASIAQASEARAIAERIPDPAMRTRALIDASFALGAATLQRDPRAAHRHLTAAIDGYRSLERPLFLPEAYLLRARTKVGEVAADLDAGIAELERHHAEGTGVLDARRELYAAAIAQALDRGEREAAFAYAERSRGVQPVSVATLQQRLRGSSTAVVELAALGKDIAAFRITEKRFDVVRTRAVIDAFASLENEQRVLVVADEPYDAIAFAALRDPRSGAPLVQRFAIALAPNASELQRDETTQPRRLVAIALPSGKNAALPESRGELADIAPLYREAKELRGDDTTFARLGDEATAADVIHISGHTEDQQGAVELALPFRGGRISSRAVAATTLLSHPIVVLAGCDTLRRPAAAQTYARSLGASFLAAGAREVVGTLAPIADSDARALFRAFHEQLQAGANAADALRRVQLAALRARSPLPWNAIAVVTNRIPSNGEESWESSRSTSLESARTCNGRTIPAGQTCPASTIASSSSTARPRT